MPMKNVRKTGNMPGKKKSRRKSKKKDKRIKVGFKTLAFIAAALLLFIALPYLTDKSGNVKGAPVPDGYATFGIDISKYQKEIVWDSLKVLTGSRDRTIKSVTKARKIYDISFVFIKATEGEDMQDDMFAEHWEKAGKAGIRRGAYHFFRSSKNPVKQAENFINTVGPLSAGDYPPILDIETLHRGGSKKKLNESAKKWLETVEKHYGVRPIIYSHDKFLNDILDKDITDRYTIWAARYGNTEPDFKNWHFWQFTDKALVYGIEGHVDLNVKRKK